jgi:hypothetical protein
MQKPTKAAKHDSGFTKCPAELLLNKELNSSAKIVWLYLKWRQGENDSAWPSLETIAADLGITEKTTRRAIKELLKLDKISIQKPQKYGRGYFNRYQIKGGKKDTLLSIKGGKNVPKKGVKMSNELYTENYIQEEEASPALTFVDLWNSKGNLPEIKSFTAQREKQLRARMAEPLFAENWQGIIERLSKSSFCTGNNGRGWKADIDWILKDSTNYAKVLEGKYDNKTDSGGAELPAPDTKAILKDMGWADADIEKFIADGNSL